MASPSAFADAEARFVVTPGAVTEHPLASVWSTPGDLIVHAYLCSEPGFVTRVSSVVSADGSRKWVSSIGYSSGGTWRKDEAEISEITYREGFRHSIGHVVKIRRLVPLDGYYWDVDVYYHDNEGLIIAETTKQMRPAQTPSWCSLDISGSTRYFDSTLAVSPVSPSVPDARRLLVGVLDLLREPTALQTIAKRHGVTPAALERARRRFVAGGRRSLSSNPDA